MTNPVIIYVFIWINTAMLDKLQNHKENLEEISEIDMGQFEYLIDIGKKNSGLDEKYKTKEYKMNGCQGQVLIKHDKKDYKHFFEGDSDAGIVKGIVTIVMESLSGLSSSELDIVSKDDFDILKLGGGLTAQRQVGLISMVEYCKNKAK